jgi:hypothetical protein
VRRLHIVRTQQHHKRGDLVREPYSATVMTDPARNSSNGAVVMVEVAMVGLVVTTTTLTTVVVF